MLTLILQNDRIIATFRVMNHSSCAIQSYAMVINIVYNH